MRLFYLQNSNDELYELSDPNKNFFYEPQGLGFSKNLEYVSNTLIRKNITNELAFGQVSGTITFYNYSEYRIFIDYIARSATLWLYYKPTSTSDTYYTQVLVSSIDKTELNRDTQTLLCSITFDLLGYWTKDEVVITGSGTGDPSGNQTYPMTYALTYGVSQGSSQFMSFVLSNNGHAPAPLAIKIRGQAINPTWVLGNQTGGLNLTIQTGQEVVVDSREDVMTITSGETILDQFKDPLKQNYIYAPVGEFTLFVEATDAEVTLYEQFASI